MTESEQLYQEAYAEHYKHKNLVEAYRRYLEIVANFPDSPECRYSEQQMRNIEKVNQEISNSNDEIVKLRKIIEEKDILREEQIKNFNERKKQELEAERQKQELEQQKQLQNMADYLENYINMVITSTSALEGYQIKEYVGFISKEVVVPNGIMGALTSGTFYTIDAMAKAKENAIEKLKNAAAEIGANAVVGLDLDVNDLNNHGVMVSANGTAVKVEKLA